MSLEFVSENCHRLHFDGNIAIDNLYPHDSKPKMYRFDLDADTYEKVSNEEYQHIFSGPVHLSLSVYKNYNFWLFLGKFREGEYARESSQDQKKVIEVIDLSNKIIRSFDIPKCVALANDHQHQVFYALVHDSLTKQMLYKYDYDFNVLSSRMITCSSGAALKCVSHDKVLICDMGCYPREFKYV